MAANQIAVSFGPEMSCALPIFHVLTCCDTVSSFAGHGKKTEQTGAQLKLAYGPKEISDDAVNIIERFVKIIGLAEPAPALKWTMQKGRSFHEYPRCNKSRLPELL